MAENVLADVPTPNGGTQKLALEADRNGFAYAIDRTSGKFLWGLPFVKKVTWTKGLDPETGKPLEYDANNPVQHYNAAVTPSRENKVTDICPGNMGGKNWPPTAYNPDLKLWYIPVIESCNRITVDGGRSGQAQGTRVLDRRRPEPTRPDHRKRNRHRRDDRQGCGQGGNAVPDAGRHVGDA